jgi:hypothetical protein
MVVGLLTCTMGNYRNPSNGENLHFMNFSLYTCEDPLLTTLAYILVVMPSNALIARYYTLEEVTLGTHEVKGYFSFIVKNIMWVGSILHKHNTQKKLVFYFR